MEKMLGFKELYEVTVKPTYDIEIGNRKIQAGEPILVFDNIQLANFDEDKNYKQASGGYQNQTWVIWESIKEERISFSQGVFSDIQLAFLSNSVLTENVVVPVPKTEQLETNEQQEIKLSHEPIIETLFVYNSDTGEKLEHTIEGKTVHVNAAPYTNIKVYYNFNYNDGKIISIGRQLLKGFLEVTGKTRFKDDRTGKTTTGILRIPKFKLMSDFSIRLGNDANPVVGYFEGVGYPVGSRGQERVMELILLHDDIDSDF